MDRDTTTRILKYLSERHTTVLEELVREVIGDSERDGDNLDVLPLEHFQEYLDKLETIISIGHALIANQEMAILLEVMEEDSE